ncbi:uncharacterized protein EAF02_007948 [Botrytis sinoallii]|uniref:uncharacterized protein n=1 Tax=Botrytis sinoallii TaxID=1463999 RepID=UPI001901DD6C|nr:uncharacterized protein EAF02_007948 [Botrytis sinoallii]KAF7879778.1 hypothetical protein EAF02_007948 [Botrytis sinoallii]
MSRLRKISPSIPEIANAIIAPRSNISTCTNLISRTLLHLPISSLLPIRPQQTFPSHQTNLRANIFSLFAFPFTSSRDSRSWSAFFGNYTDGFFGARCIREYADAEYEY